MAEFSQLPSGPAAGDAALMSPQAIKEALDLQVVRWQTGDIVAGQQLFSTTVPQTLQFTAERHLGTPVPLHGLELLLEKLHLLSDLFTRDLLLGIVAGRVA